MNVGAALLKVDALGVRFGGINALENVSFDIPNGDIVGLIGPNGAGKTTCFHCITRLYTPVAGTIEFCGDDLLRYSARDIVGRGIARTFQNGALFAQMPVIDNVLVGLHHRHLKERAARREAYAMIAYLGLDRVATQPVGALPYGDRKSVELARALVAKPQLLLLDEPAAGLSHDEVAALALTLQRIRIDFGLTMVMVEHHMALVMGVCDTLIVLDAGRKIAHGAPQAIGNDRTVIDAYLGVF